MAKTIYHIHLCAPTYQNKGLTKGMIARGFSVEVFDWQKERIILGTERMRAKIIKQVKELKPSLVFAQIQSEGVLDVETAKAIMDVAPLCLFTVDTRREDQMEWLYTLNQYVTHVFYSNGRDVSNCNRKGLITNCSVLQSSCDETEYYPLPKDPSLNVPDIVFIGSKTVKFPLSAERTAMVELLIKEHPTLFQAYGLGWENSEGYCPVKKERQLYSNAKICLLHNQFDYPLYESDRKWRIMACGGTAAKWKEGSFIFDYPNPEIKPGCDLPHEQQVRNYFLNNHTYAHRIREVEKVLGNLYGMSFL